MQKPKAIKVVVDTNWWVSFVIKSYRNQLLQVLLDDRIDIFCSPELEQEVIETLHEPRLAKFLYPDTVQDFMSVFPQVLVMAQVKSKVTVCRDAKDNFLLALSKDAKADYLVTGDKDLLGMGKFGKTKILTMTEFLKKLSEV